MTVLTNKMAAEAASAQPSNAQTDSHNTTVPIAWTVNTRKLPMLHADLDGDNGTGGSWPIGGRRLAGAKRGLGDGGATVPMIACWPGTTPAGKVCDDLVGFEDFLPTFADVAGAPLPKDKVLDGVNFAPQLRGQKGTPREWIFTQYRDQWFVRDQRRKLYNDGRLVDTSDYPFNEKKLPADAEPEVRQKFQKIADDLGVDKVMKAHPEWLKNKEGQALFPMNHNPNCGNNREEKPMNLWTKGMWSAVLAAFSVAIGAQAVEPPKVTPSNDPNVSSTTQWTLTTDDTHLNLSVANHRISIDSLKNPKQNWNWTPVASEVPLIKSVVINGEPQSPDWKYQNATVDRTTGTTVTLTFSSTAPQLELKSIWRVRPGVGPVEHRIDIVNKTAGEVVFKGDDIEAANLNVVADKPVQFFPHDAGKVGHGERTPLPYQIVKVGSAHGIYFAYDYGCGHYQAIRDPANPLRVNCRFWVGNKVSTTIAVGETFHLPGIMIQTYQGDEDDAANRFRKWFWNYEITPSLRNNPNEPPIEICNDVKQDGNPDFLVNQAKTVDFADWGVGCLKTDLWHWSTGHARSDEIAAALHAKGIKLSLYFNDNDMVAKPDDQVALTILLDEAKKSKFDYYRSDVFKGPHFVNMGDYHSVESFKRRLEALAKAGVGWENCANGGNVRSLDVCRRMTFMTHSDDSGLIPFFNNVYHWSYMMCPIQLKSDYPIGGRYGKTVAVIRGYLLGAILVGFPSDPVFLSKLAEIKRVFHLYNTKQRPILRGADVYHILPPPAKDQWFGLQYYNTFINKGSVLLWQNGGPASQIIKLKGLDRNATYTLTFEDATGKNGSMTGAKLMDDGIEVPMGPNASEIIWIENPNGKPESKPAAP